MFALTCFPLEEVAHLVLGAAVLTEDTHVEEEIELAERDVVCILEVRALAGRRSRSRGGRRQRQHALSDGGPAFAYRY